MTYSTAQMNEYMKRRYEKRRARAIKMLGGCCVNCGSEDRLEFDHIDPSIKRFSFSKIWNNSLAQFDKELEKAQLLCHDCHVLKTSDERGVPHGGGVAGKRNCSCKPCKIKKAEYMRRYK